MDAEIGMNYQSNEVVRCIHIALLCVQTDPDDRPDIAKIILMLAGNLIILQLPQSPLYEGLEIVACISYCLVLMSSFQGESKSRCPCFP